MAASDKPFNDQRKLDIVFGVSNILMFLATVWMLWQDHFREFKVEQRVFVDVEVAMAQHLALQSLPSMSDFQKKKEAVERAAKDRKNKEDELKAANAKLDELKPKRAKADARYQDLKSDVESFTSLLNQGKEFNNKEMQEKYEKLLADRNPKLDEAQAKRDAIVAEIKAQQLKIERIEQPYTEAAADFKKINDKFDAQVKAALTKRWGFTNWLRAVPVIDAFASPYRIHQFTIEDIPIDYNFKRVTRFDRCMTCHQGIDRAPFTRENLTALTKPPDLSKYKDALDIYKIRYDTVQSEKEKRSIPDPNRLQIDPNSDRPWISDKELTPSRI